MLRRAGRALQRAAGFRVAHASAPLRWLPVGRRYTTRVCDASVACRARSNRSVPYVRKLHQREASLSWCKTVVQRVGSILQRAAGDCEAHASAPLRWLSVGRRRSTRACDARAPCRAGCGRCMPLKRHCTSAELLPLIARPCSGVLAAPSNEQPAFVWRTQARHCVGSLWGGGAPRAFATRARRATLVLIGPYHTYGYCTSEKPHFLGERPCSDV